jgi:hypothetical protein
MDTARRVRTGGAGALREEGQKERGEGPQRSAATDQTNGM